jgi:ADP-heptose:LPS heptosyltransferase
VLPIRRKFRSAVWRINDIAKRSYCTAIQYLVDVATQKYWLLDYVPTFFKKKSGILLIRLDLIGDFVLWLDSARAYRHLYPNQKISLLVNSTCMGLAESLAHWDEVIGVDIHQLRANYLYRLFIFMRIRWCNYKVAIQPTFSRELIGDLSARATNADERFGYEGDSNNLSQSEKEITDRWYTKLVVNEPNTTMELNINAHFVRQLGCTSFLSNVPIIPPISTLTLHPPIAKPYIVVAPSASWAPKMWPTNNFSILVEQLISKFKLHVVLCGGRNDYPLCELLRQNLNNDHITNLAGDTTLPELTELIRHAQLVISNDSSPVHIAAAVSTPSVCILGGGHFGRFLPYQVEHSEPRVRPTAVFDVMECFDCHWRCKFHLEAGESVPCITNITINHVLQNCEVTLNALPKITQ